MEGGEEAMFSAGRQHMHRCAMMRQRRRTCRGVSLTARERVVATGMV